MCHWGIMKLFKWVCILFFTGVMALGILTLHPETIPQLTTNFRKNLIRSFEDSGMQNTTENQRSFHLATANQMVVFENCSSYAS